MLRICNEKRKIYNLEIIPGIEFRRDNQLIYIAIPYDNAGFEEINRFLSYHNNIEKPLPHHAPEFSNAFIIFPRKNVPEFLRENEFIGIQPHEINKMVSSSLEKMLHKLVALYPVTVKNKAGYNTHRLLRAVDQNVVLSKLSPELQGRPDEIMINESELLLRYARYPELVRRSSEILNQCSFSLEFYTDKNKKTFTESKGSDRSLLESLALEGLSKRYNSGFKPKARLYHELEIISRRSFESYFLIAHDIISFAKHKNFAFVGRGSGANSITAYCLGLTQVDPLELDLYFERFLNPERSSPPDFDIDFSWKDRDEVTTYIFNRYHKDHTALLGTHTTFKDRSIIRELGKVFGLPKPEIDNLVTYPDTYRHKDNITEMIFKYGERMLSIPNNLSIHAGGVLITEKPIYAYTATDLPPKGYPTSHFEMHNAEDIGIYKLDILSQRGLGHIKDTIATVKSNQGIDIDINRFQDFKKDADIKKLLSKGHTMGCFYVESPAMRQLLGKLECQDYITLVAASSIIRPGVARSGMMRAYIYRHHHPNDYQSIHPKMDELMKETYGVMVYQEDVIKVAHHFGGLTLSEADILRRGMSGKFRSREEFKRVEVKFFSNCKERGYADEVTARVWYEIESFSGYSFSKGHSASYAVESYQSLFLKAHYPLEFMVGVINNFGGFYRTEFYFHEARMNGATIEAPCVNNSCYLTSITGTCIWMGFIHLKSLEIKVAKQIEEERNKKGKFRSLDNFIRRIPIGLEQVSILIRIGAFRFTGKTKRELLWEAHLYFGKVNKKEFAEASNELFETEPMQYKLPQLEPAPFEDAFDELELLGFPLYHPFDLLESKPRAVAKAEDLKKKTNQKLEIIGYLITIKYTSTKNNLPMQFGTFYDEDGEVFDTTHFPGSARKFPFRGKGFYRIKGKVVEDFGYPMIEVHFMEKLPMVTNQ
jgi:DNA polymerase-3 subunit alpha